MSRCGAKMEGEEKMRRKIVEIYEVENEAFEQYLHAIGAYIDYLDKQMEEVYWK